MKRTITLMAFMVLVTLFAFGQRTELKHNEKFWKSKIEKQLKGLKQDDNCVRQGHLFQKNKNFSKNSRLKSSLAITQRLDSIVDQYWS
ncbi:MAG: hypothetical protein ABSF81_18465 [Bacteroidales bacterium]